MSIWLIGWFQTLNCLLFFSYFFRFDYRTTLTIHSTRMKMTCCLNSRFLSYLQLTYLQKNHLNSLIPQQYQTSLSLRFLIGLQSLMKMKLKCLLGQWTLMSILNGRLAFSRKIFSNYQVWLSKCWYYHHVSLKVLNPMPLTIYPIRLYEFHHHRARFSRPLSDCNLLLPDHVQKCLRVNRSLLFPYSLAFDKLLINALIDWLPFRWFPHLGLRLIFWFLQNFLCNPCCLHHLTTRSSCSFRKETDSFAFSTEPHWKVC